LSAVAFLFLTHDTATVAEAVDSPAAIIVKTPRAVDEQEAEDSPSTLRTLSQSAVFDADAEIAADAF
jgi:hypothetical protein